MTFKVISVNTVQAAFVEFKGSAVTFLDRYSDILIHYRDILIVLS